MNDITLEKARSDLNKALNDISVKKRRLSTGEKATYSRLCHDVMEGAGLEVVTDYSIPCMVNANFEIVTEALSHQ